MKKYIKVIINVTLFVTSFFAFLVLAGECEDFRTFMLGKILAIVWIIISCLISKRTAPGLWGE